MYRVIVVECFIVNKENVQCTNASKKRKREKKEE